MIVEEKLPSSHSHFRIVWQVTAQGEENANQQKLPSVIKHRWLFITSVSGNGTITVKGGESLPNTTVVWDTVASVSVTTGGTVSQNLSGFYPYEYYKVEFVKSDPNDPAPINIFVIIKGDI